jgi:uncharacterized membrane protein
MSTAMDRETLPLQTTAGGGLTRDRPPRIAEIDLLRGFVIALMVLDHVRDFFLTQAFAFSHTDPERTTLALYATRWATHLCAPTFVFLAGASIFLQQANGKSSRQLARFLALRGAWLLVLELTIVGFGFNFAPIVFLQVIWAIGMGMVLLAVLVRFSPRAIGTLGAVIVVGHGLLAPIDAGDLGSLGLVWTLLFELSFVPNLGLIAYPLVPWFGVMCLGYALGFIFTLPLERRRRALATAGAVALVAFVIVRTLNGYGDPARWRSFETISQTVMSFLNVSKYPPSLLFVLVTLGPSLLITPLLMRLRGSLANLLLAFGRTPLFTYVLHIYVAHGAALIIGIAMGLPAAAFRNFILDPSPLSNSNWGFPLAGVYVAWVGVLALLYPLSAWFADVKRRRRDWWLSYV